MVLTMCGFLIFLAPLISAEKTVKTIDGYFGFKSQTVADKFYEKTRTIDPPDGISEIINVQFFIRGDFSANTSIFTKVNNQSCTPNYWQIPNKNTLNYDIIFDCTDLVQPFKGGEINLSFMTDKIAQNIVGTYRMTYYNNPRPEIIIFGTEYVGGDEGTVFLQLLDSNRNPIDDGYCQLTIFYPDDNKTVWYDNINMDFLSNGIYYRDMVLPEDAGIYMTNVYCYYADILYEFKLPDSVLYDGDLYQGSTDDAVNVEDTDCILIKTEDGRYHEFRFDNPEIGNINLSTITSIDLIWVGMHEDDAYLQMWNFSDSSWDNIGNEINYWFGGDECWDTHAVSRTTQTGFNNYVSGNEARFRIYLDSGGKKVWTDEATIIFHNNGSIISDIRGSGEIHVSDALVNLSVNLDINASETLVYEIWNYSNRTTQEEYEIIVSGTEYNSNETGTLYAQFLRTVWGSPNPINDGFCNITIYYPNETIFVNNQNMPYINGSNGIYKHNFTVPETEGVYVADVSCRRGFIMAYSSETFHIGEWANRISTGNITLNVTAEVDLSEVYANQTKIYNYLLSMNSSLHNKIVFLENLMLQINGSLWDKLFLIQEELANITDLVIEVGQNITTTNSSIHTHIDEINASIFIKLDEILTEIQNININTTELENLILNLNTTLHSHLDANNLTVMTKLYSIQTELQQIINNQSNIYNHISNVNQSIFNKLIDLEVDLSDILANQTKIYNLLTYVNNTLINLQSDVTTILNNQVDILNNQTTIYNKLLSLEVDISNVLNNQTTIYDYLVQHNSTVMNKLYGIQDELAYILNNQSTIYNYLVAHNQSVLNELLNLQIDVDNILSNQTTINDHITDINVTIMNELYYIEGLIGNISVNTTELENLIRNTNLTIMTKLHGVQGELAQILENQTIIKQMIYDHNTTIYDKLLEVQGNLVYISNQINNTNQTLYDMIYGTNLTIMTKLYGVQDELANITDLINTSITLIYNTNETIMTYLYSMNFTLWSEIYNIWNSIANVTNISMEITANMTTLPREVYLYFQAVEERLVHNNDFCTTNGTVHRKELLIEKCVAGTCWNQSKFIDEVCPYGCVQGTCLPTPTVKYSMFIVAILLMCGFMYLMYQIARRV